MPKFAFRARGRDGKTLKGVRVAANQAALAQDLLAETLFLVSAELARSGPKGIIGPKLKRKDLVGFLLHLGSYVEAGVPLLSALEDYRIPENPTVDAAIQDLRRKIEGGASLSMAMETYPTLFAPLQVSMIRAGEGSGHLDESIREVVKLVEWEEDFSGQVKQASIYPAIVVSLLMGISILVSMVVLPKIIKLLEELNTPLPLPSRIFMAFGSFMANWAWLVGLATVGAVIGIKIGLKTPAFRLWWDTRVLQLPIVGPLATKLGLSRFATFFAAQYRAGIPIVQVLRECQAVVGNARLALSVRRIREGIEAGERLAVVAAQVGFFPALVVRMLAIGEEAGNLEVTLGKVAAYFDQEVRTGIKRFFQLLEPLLLVLLAGVIVFVAVAILLPIYTMIGNINSQAR